MVTVLDTFGDGRALLLSPEFETSSLSCLQYKTKLVISPTYNLVKNPCNVKYGSLKVSFTSDDSSPVSDLIVEQCNTWMTYNVSLPAGLRTSVLFDFETIIASSFLEQMEAEVMFWLTDVKIVDMVCETSEY